MQLPSIINNQALLINNNINPDSYVFSRNFSVDTHSQITSRSKMVARAQTTSSVFQEVGRQEDRKKDKHAPS